MQRIWIPRFGDPSVLELRDEPDPEPAPGELRVKVAAAGVNFADLMARMGTYQDAPPLPMVVGYEVSGVVEAVGEGVDSARVGERVVAMTRFGGYASKVCVPADTVAMVPVGLDLVTGAAVPVVYLTAWMMLEVMGRVRAGDRVLVHSAAGGVGLASLDLLKWRGAVAVGTASPGKHEWLRERGYDQLVDYRNHDYEEVLRADDGFDLILDPVGGESWAKGLRLLRAGGRLVGFGMSANATGDRRSMLTMAKNLWQVPWLATNPISLINANKGFLGVNMGRLWDERARASAWLREVLSLWEQGVVRPHVHATVPFGDAAEAHRMLHARETFGKVLLVPDAPGE